MQRPATAPVCADLGGVLGILGYVQLTWPHRDSRYAYSYTLTRLDTGTSVSGTVSAAGAVNSPVVLDIQTPLLGGGLGPNVNVDVTIRSFLSSNPTWISGAGWTTRVHTVSILGLGLGLSVRCGSA